MTSDMQVASRLTDGFVGGRRLPEQPAEQEVERALALATASMPRLRRLSGGDRAAILRRVGAALASAKRELATEMVAESGYLTYRDMVLEVERAIEVFDLSAALALTGTDETVNVDATARGRGAMAFVRRVPIGPVLGITAFNGPLLIAAHKAAPAIVAGAAVILKPSPRVPRSTIRLAELVVAAGWPAEAIAVLSVDDETTMRLVRDPRLPVVSFTGGSFGWRLKEAVPRKRVHLELGGVGAVIVDDDADLDDAAEQCAIGAFVRSGQACISVQRVYALPGAFDGMVQRLRDRVGAMRLGPPDDETADVGPMVDEAAALRVEALIADARDRGAEVAVGGARDGAYVEPTLIVGATADMAILRREAFGPVLAISRVGSLEEAVAETNAVGGAIHAGVFSNDLDRALSAADAIEAGGVIVNGSTAWRSDNMPYGGVGQSGFGREGIASMVDEITEPKVIVLRRRTP